MSHLSLATISYHLVAIGCAESSTLLPNISKFALHASLPCLVAFIVKVSTAAEQCDFEAIHYMSHGHLCAFLKRIIMKHLCNFNFIPATLSNLVNC